MASKTTKTIGIRMPNEVMAQLRQEAGRRDMTVTSYINNIIDDRDAAARGFEDAAECLDECLDKINSLEDAKRYIQACARAYRRSAARMPHKIDDWVQDVDGIADIRRYMQECANVLP